MKKRLVKKRNKIINERIKFFNSHMNISLPRRNGKTYLQKQIMKVCYSKSYKDFEIFRKFYCAILNIKPNN